MYYCPRCKKMVDIAKRVALQITFIDYTGNFNVVVYGKCSEIILDFDGE